MLTHWLQRSRVLPPYSGRLGPIMREAEAFDFAVISALDMIASTPDVDLAGIRLVRKEAVWLYEDPAIEGLPAIQKQVLRMGPDNAAIVKDKASQARTVWVATLSEAPERGDGCNSDPAALLNDVIVPSSSPSTSA